MKPAFAVPKANPPAPAKISMDLTLILQKKGPQSVKQLAFVSKLALPNHHQPLSKPLQSSLVYKIAMSVPIEFLAPERDARLGHSRELTTRMTMPKAA